MAEPNPDAKARKREYQRQWAAENRDRIREQRRQYRAANRDKIAAQKQAWADANRSKISEQNRRYREANTEKIREQRVGHYQANRGKRRERDRQYYAENRDDVLVRVKRYADANRPQIQEYKHRYYQVSGAKVRQKVLEGSHGRDIAADWAVMWEAQQGRCYLCERDMDPDDAHVEHWHGCAAHGPKKSCRYCRRGLAHQNCNLVVGHAADDPSLLRIIADNLERANADIAARQAVMPQHITLF